MSSVFSLSLRLIDQYHSMDKVLNKGKMGTSAFLSRYTIIISKLFTSNIAQYKGHKQKIKKKCAFAF